LLAFILCSHLAARQKEVPAQNGTFTIESKVDVAVVPVLVRDAHGHAIGDLKKEDFQILDNGKPQMVTGFTIQQRAGLETGTPGAQPSAGLTVTPQWAVVPNRFIVFLFDDMHLSAGDLALAQKAGTKMLAGSLTESDMAAVVSISGCTNSGFTRDLAVLQDAIMKLHPQGMYRATGSECPNLDYHQADLIANKHNSAALEAAIDETFSCSPGLGMRNLAESMAESAATRSVAMGDQDVRVTLLALGEYVRRMAALPGSRTLILVSPGFLILNPESRSEESHIMDTAAQSNVTVSALDARGLYTLEIDASERTRGSAQTAQLKSEYHRDSMSLSEDVMAELADGTGGTYFHNSNDLEGGFKRLTTAPEYLYLLEFSVKNVKQDGTYHRLKVKVDRSGLNLQARHGYFAPKPVKHRKR
jgi:VWFA-related protein